MPLRERIYSIAKMGGLFELARRCTPHDLRILCYHGFSMNDEHLFRPKLFQTPDSFARRMRWLKDCGYRTLSLDEAFDRLQRGVLGSKDVVITIDDGFSSVAARAAPILSALGFTAAIYVTTYYVRHNNPVFRIAVQYLFWKTSRESLPIGDLLPDTEPLAGASGEEGEQTMEKLIEFGETQLDEPGRLALLGTLARRLEVDFEELVASRRLTLMNEAELAELVRQGFDIQLHTHRHRLPASERGLTRELVDNRAVLSPLTKRPLKHFCYPSGIWTRNAWPQLASQGVETATTCDPGLVSRNTPSLAWPRFLDFESTPQIVFEAEMSGFAHLLRQAAGRGN